MVRYDFLVLMIGATSNAVNLTDGLDGLATGAAILVLAGYLLIANWQLRNDCTVLLTQNCYFVTHALDSRIPPWSCEHSCCQFRNARILFISKYIQQVALGRKCQFGNV